MSKMLNVFLNFLFLIDNLEKCDTRNCPEPVDIVRLENLYFYIWLGPNRLHSIDNSLWK